ncbi:MAG: N-acetyltransferase [Candidatus Sedimenticola sp. 20ELBAFRAG]
MKHNKRVNTCIRAATSLDRDDIRDIHLRAFPESENQLVARLAVNLLSEETSPETIALVAEADGTVVGHIAFSPVTSDADKHWQGYILAPLGVQPNYQKSGIGSKLIESGIELLSAKKVDVVFVYGDPKYYGKFGFKAEAADRFPPPYELQYPFGWQAIVLHERGFDENATRISCVASLCDPGLW